jgi:spore maturation protein CgeB
MKALNNHIASVSTMPGPLRLVFSSHPAEWVQLNMFDTLREMGVDLIVHDWGKDYNFHGTDWMEVQRTRLNQDLLQLVQREHKKAPIDLLITYYWGRHTDGKVIDAIRDLGIRCVNFGCNNLHQFHIVKPLIGHYDYHWVTERDAVKMFTDAGGAAVRVQQGANPKHYFPVKVERKYDMTFTGSCYGDRIDIFSKIARAGLDFHVFGFRWRDKRSFHRVIGEQLVPWRVFHKYQGVGLENGKEELTRQCLETEHLVRRLGGLGYERFPGMVPAFSPLLHPSIPFQDMVRLFSESKISMGFSACGSPSDMRKGRLVQVKLRDFEAPMSGALLFTEYQEELKEFFEIGKEIVCYHDGEDLIEKAKHFLSEPEEAERIRVAARARSLRDHTWKKRFEELFTKLKLRTA